MCVVIVRSVVVDRVETCMLCACVSEEHGNREGVVLHEVYRFSYTRKYISLVVRDVTKRNTGRPPFGPHDGL